MFSKNIHRIMLPTIYYTGMPYNIRVCVSIPIYYAVCRNVKMCRYTELRFRFRFQNINGYFIIFGSQNLNNNPHVYDIGNTIFRSCDKDGHDIVFTSYIFQRI